MYARVKWLKDIWDEGGNPEFTIFLIDKSVIYIQEEILQFDIEHDVITIVTEFKDIRFNVAYIKYIT